jgi:hypothetical protein
MKNPSAHDTMAVSFFNNGAGSQVSGPVTVTPGHPQHVGLRFQDSSQLEISCSARQHGHPVLEYMQLALGNGTIGPG